MVNTNQTLPCTQFGSKHIRVRVCVCVSLHTCDMCKFVCKLVFSLSGSSCSSLKHRWWHKASQQTSQDNTVPPDIRSLLVFILILAAFLFSCWHWSKQNSAEQYMTIPLVKFLLIGLPPANHKTCANEQTLRVDKGRFDLFIYPSVFHYHPFVSFSVSLSPPITMSASALMSPLLPCSG